MGLLFIFLGGGTLDYRLVDSLVSLLKLYFSLPRNSCNLFTGRNISLLSWLVNMPVYIYSWYHQNYCCSIVTYCEFAIVVYAKTSNFYVGLLIILCTLPIFVSGMVGIYFCPGKLITTMLSWLRIPSINHSGSFQ